MKLHAVVLTLLLLGGGWVAVGCSSGEPSGPANSGSAPRDPNDAGTGALGGTADHPGGYSTSNTGTTDSHHELGVPGNGAPK